ncbi:unnamed protein product [Phytophthora lilii]|uniref:Unnamed protein product n=1 Tax=Phytophthora lilii TaxID=2077276 RepID=A0A9W6TH22_9STRA|nr:unnamed protein product [Phytophthora lilii]
MPELATLIASALHLDASPAATEAAAATSSATEAAAPETAKAAPPSPPRAANSLIGPPTISPSAKDESNRKRRKRESIKLPPNTPVAKLSHKELRRLKNRISATRLRERSQQNLRELHDQLQHYKLRCEYLEMVVAGCPACAKFGAVHFGEIELLPADMLRIKTEKNADELELIDDSELPVLTEAECVVLGNALHC